MNKIEIINTLDEEIKELAEISKLMDYACNFMKLDNVTFNIIIVDNNTIHKINKDYRGIDRPTDVISFALEDEKDMILDSEVGRILGDIYISIDKCREQAKEYGHSFLRELAFLSVHGFLHLQGYDHMEKKDEEVMFKLQDDILDSYGIRRG
ncbi:MAG: rRNA maturation RNase YbeY [Bacilli bacterium]|nr:rRNA maturation RNase YbeY [Bacilli bacterium]